MRKKQSHSLYSNNMPVQPAAYSHATPVVSADFSSLAGHSLFKQTIKSVYISISLPAIDEITGELTGWQNR